MMAIAMMTSLKTFQLQNTASLNSVPTMGVFTCTILHDYD